MLPVLQRFVGTHIVLFCFVFFRFTILPSEDKVVPMFNKISKFHKEFMEKYRDNDVMQK